VSDVVVDASAILALLNAEPGAEAVATRLPHAIISTVNLAEVVTRLAAVKMPEDEIRTVLGLLGLTTVEFDEAQAIQAGLFYPDTHSFGLSLGDRACLALAHHLQAPALTADRVWRELGIDVIVELIR